MSEATDQALLLEYVERRSETAFAELVDRHVDLVYATALRTVRDRHLADDVTQGAFLALARSAATLTQRPVLAGWLHRTTQYIAAQTVRTDVRRRARELAAVALGESPGSAPTDAAWQQIADQLDDALADLPDGDREALLLRYFRRQTANDMAHLLGTSAEAAQKRVSRAVDRLREALAHRGLPVGVGGLTAALAAQAAQPAPAHLTGSLVTAALPASATSATTGASAALLTPAAMTTTFLQKAAFSALLVLAAGSAFFQARQAAAVRAELDAVRAEMAVTAAELGRLSVDNAQLTADAARASNLVAQAREQHTELLRLRGEVGVLRQQKRAWSHASASNRTTPSAAETKAPIEPPTPPPPFQIRLVVDGGGDGAEVLPPAEGVGGDAANLTVDKTPLMDHLTIQSANVLVDPSSGHPQIEVEFTDQGRELFARVTREHLNQRLAIALDGKLYAAPVIRSEIAGGKAMITGTFTEEQAWELAAKINLALGNR